MARALRTPADLLAATPLLRNADGGAIDKLAAEGIERSYARGASVFREGQPSRGLLVVWEGAVKVFKLGTGGRELVLELEGPGRSIAELPLLDGEPYPASCAAVEDSVLLVIPPAPFHRIMSTEPSLARCVISNLSRRLRHMVFLVEEISLKEVRGRLAGLLLDLAGEGDTIRLPGSHQLLAARIGTVREMVSRQLSRMTHEGVIRVDGRNVTILDRERL